LVLTGPLRICELEDRIGTQALNIHVPALIDGVRRARGVGVDLIREAVDNVCVSAIGLPARPVCCPMRAGVRKPAVIVFFTAFMALYNGQPAAIENSNNVARLQLSSRWPGISQEGS
jgi:hypothetical protein